MQGVWGRQALFPHTPLVLAHPRALTLPLSALATYTHPMPLDMPIPSQARVLRLLPLALSSAGRPAAP
jgi:hypothetical protein